MSHRFGSDQVLIYNVEPWAQLGFGCANFGDNEFTQSAPLARLADEIGRVQLFVMTHVDAARHSPPSRNTAERLGRILNRIQTVLESRAKAYPEKRLEPGHGSPAPTAWNIHPVPYFNGPVVRNGWLAEYNHLTMIALANIYQHSDNDLALTITEAAAADVWSYFREVKNMLAGELLGLPTATYEAPGFRFSADVWTNYRPDEVTIRIESLDHPGPVTTRYTEDDLRKFLQGIPANLIAPNLARYPVGVGPFTSQGDEIDGSVSGDVGPDGANTEAQTQANIDDPQL